MRESEIELIVDSLNRKLRDVYITYIERRFSNNCEKIVILVEFTKLRIAFSKAIFIEDFRFNNLIILIKEGLFNILEKDLNLIATS